MSVGGWSAYFFFFFKSPGPPQDLPSSPTRRSSDLDDLGDRMAHVRGGEELPLFDVDGATGVRRGDQQVGLARQERGDLEDVCDFRGRPRLRGVRSEEHTSELQSHVNLVCRLLLEKK